MFSDIINAFYTIQKNGIKDFKKIEDLINYKKEFGYKFIFENWYYSLELFLQTQFTNGYEQDTNLISTIVSPLYSNLGLGALYKIPDFTMFLSPFSKKMTIVASQYLADKGSYGVKPAKYDLKGNKIQNGEHIFIALGVLFTADWKIILWENINLRNKIRLYSNYLENFGVVDLDWEMLFNLIINKWVILNIRSRIVFDDKAKFFSPGATKGVSKIQFLRTISLGLVYDF